MPTISINVGSTKEEVKLHLAERAAKRRAEIVQRKLEEARRSKNTSNILLNFLLIPLKWLHYLNNSQYDKNSSYR